MEFKELVKTMQEIEDDNRITEEIVIAALEEAIAKAYRKHVEIPDVLVRVEFNKDDKQIHAFQQWTIVEEVEDEELEISLEDAKKQNPDAELGGVVEKEVSIDGFGRAAVLLAKNVLKQKIREAQKQNVYDEYIDKIGELVIGVVDKVEERFVLVNLDKAQAMLPKTAQMPQESYHEGQQLKVIISQVSKDTKGSQVLVSRADATLVKRLFENEVPEIYQGIVEIKAIAREVGERTKMAVYSHKSEVDAIGACIGPRGSRVQVVIEELKGEKIDIFEWSEDITELIKNALSPAAVVAVIQNEEDPKTLLVVVEDNQLSLAIGKKGKNVRLAVTLTGKKIDIKTRSDVSEQGINIEEVLMEQKAKKQAEIAMKQAEEAERLAQLEQQREQEMLKAAEEMNENVVEEVPLFEEVEAEPQAKEVEKVVEKKRKPKLEAKASDYISKFEAIADASKTEKSSSALARKKRDFDKKEDERRLKLKDMLKDKDYDIKPEYSQEELAQIEAEQAKAEQGWYDDDIDFEDFDEYYEKD